MWPKEEKVEGVVEGEAEAGPGGAAVAPLEAEVVAGREDTGGRGNACDKQSPPVSETAALGENDTELSQSAKSNRRWVK